MFLNLKNKINTNFFFSFLLSILPISFIAGNLIINLNIVLIIFFSFLFYGKDLLKIRFFFIDKIILLFFFLIIFSGIYNDIYFIVTDAYPTGYNTIIKSILFLRYLFLYIAVRFLIEKNIINLKFFFVSCLFCSLFVSLDIFYQFIFGKDIFGIATVQSKRLSGPFGEELIAGGYLLRFSIISLFTLPLFYNKLSQNFIRSTICLLVLIFLCGVILSGNRMPLIMYVLTISLITIFQRNTRKYFFVFLPAFIILFVVIFNLYAPAKNHFHSFYNQIYKIAVLVYDKDFKNKNAPPHLREFATFYDTWLINKYIGGGIKNFRYYCHVRPNVDTSNSKCNMHPHNYYLEILTETGIIGGVISIIIFFQILFLTFYKKYFSDDNLAKNNLIIPFIFLFISEIFPLKSTGSFFTTNNATYLFLIIAILIGIANKNKLIENNI